MSRRRMIYEGKAKILYEGPEPGTLIQYFKDDTTPFDAPKKAVLEGKGVINVLRLPDNSRVLRLTNFQVLNGPDLHVYLVPIDPVPNSIGVDIAGSIDLGKLKGNLGDQNYPLPANLDLKQFKSVVIWCQPFRVPFIAAPLGSPF